MSLLRQPILNTCRRSPTSLYIARLPNIRTMSGKDQYTAKAVNDPSLTEKLVDLRAFIKAQGSVNLVSRAPDGSLHARCMAPAEITPDWKFRFIYDRDSYKEKEVENE